MLNRRESRRVALQTLFYKDFKKDQDWEKNYEYTLSDFFDAKEENGKEVERIKKDEYSYNLVKSVLEKKETLDEIIKKAAPNWPLENISNINRNILRIGIYELLFNKNVPAPVAINEAIILSKEFNTRESEHSFISGVLSAVLEASGLENDESKNKIQKEEKVKFGFLPYYFENGKIKVALVYNIFNKWTLPKGSIEGKFSNEEEAIQDIAKRKFNLEGKLGEGIGGHSYSAGIVDDKKIIKTINYFLFKVSNPEEAKLNPKLEGLNEIKFFDIDEIKNLETYGDIHNFLDKAKKILLEKTENEKNKK